ncbi:MAG: NAD(P)/FAD-dependent oxidoreductase [Thermodesulfobacteriota bacterium]
MEKYDAIVIGAGNGGLTAATTLAQKGLAVLLLERHNVPGGAATSFCRGRFEFEVALHQLSGLGRPDFPGPLRGLLQGLGVLDELDFIEMKELYSVYRPGGFHLALHTDRARTVAALQEAFPAEKANIARFFDLVYTYAGEFIAAFVFRDPEAGRAKYPVLHRQAFRKVQDVLDEFFTDPLLKAVLSVYWGYLGVTPDEMTFAYLALLFWTYMEFKPYHLKGGSQALSNALAARFQALGGRIRYNCGAGKILVRDGAVAGVVTDQDEEIQTRFVVSNVSPVLTYLKLIGPQAVPAGAFDEMRGRSLSVSAFTMYIGFDCEPAELGFTEPTNFLLGSLDQIEGPKRSMRSLDISDELIVLSCYDVAAPDFSGPGTCQANVVTLKYGEPWLRLPPSRYYDVKYQCGRGMLGRISQIWPKVTDHIEELDVATPLTHLRYLGHPAGAIYGYEQRAKDSMFFQPGRRSAVAGLFFAGGWSGDCGFQPTLEAGQAAAKSIIRQLGA